MLWSDISVPVHEDYLSQSKQVVFTWLLFIPKKQYVGKKGHQERDQNQMVLNGLVSSGKDTRHSSGSTVIHTHTYGQLSVLNYLFYLITSWAFKWVPKTPNISKYLVWFKVLTVWLQWCLSSPQTSWWWQNSSFLHSCSVCLCLCWCGLNV